METSFGVRTSMEIFNNLLLDHCTTTKIINQTCSLNGDFLFTYLIFKIKYELEQCLHQTCLLRVSHLPHKSYSEPTNTDYATDECRVGICNAKVFLFAIFRWVLKSYFAYKCITNAKLGYILEN